MIHLLLAAIAMIAVAAPAQALEPEQLEILDLRLGMDKAEADRIVQEMGYALKGPSNRSFPCNRNLDGVIGQRADKGRTTINQAELGCAEYLESGESKLRLDYLLSPAGYVLSSARYNFKSAETEADIADRLTEKFGVPCGKRPPFWGTGAKCNEEAAYLRYEHSSNFHQLTMRAASDWRRAFHEEAEKTLASRVAKPRTAL